MVLINDFLSTFNNCFSITVFGNFGFYTILKGSVTPLSEPYLNAPGTRLRAVTPEPSERIEVCVSNIYF